ncbi:hypothetical protein EMIT0P294_20360 [Pseudomonas sp. IT-P294]
MRFRLLLGAIRYCTSRPSMWCVDTVTIVMQPISMRPLGYGGLEVFSWLVRFRIGNGELGWWSLRGPYHTAQHCLFGALDLVCQGLRWSDSCQIIRLRNIIKKTDINQLDMHA